MTASAEADVSTLAPAAETIKDGDGLFHFETVQLTDRVIANLTAHQLSGISQFSFKDDTPSATKKRESGQCKTYPGDPDWPSDDTWNLFNLLLGGALINTVPEAAVCYQDWSVYNDSQCETIIGNWGDSTVR